MNSWICYNELVEDDNKRDDMNILDFKRSVTMGLLAKGLNIGKPAGRAGNLEETVHFSANVQNKRRKSRLSTYLSSWKLENGVNGVRESVKELRWSDGKIK